jgi:non-specific serine/threonine protein kinase/serine/threonine-protein kinase
MSEPPINDIPAVSGPDYQEGNKPPESLPIIKGYKIIKQLGEGGMGIVYLAEQTEPIKRKVALKIIKPGMDSKEVIARFEAEKQTLAQLDHPNIAHVYDAGTTENGRPYFVMEYINGVPITDFCDQQRLSIEERLELFKQVCEGIQHAHQRGIIHRDIKPSNILILTEQDKAIPKVIDFGVAKAISPQLSEQTMFTAQGQLIGTPEYMSPEQADFTGNNIDTRTDVYSLGVVLYQLLTGALPFDPRTLREAAFAEIQRIIKEEEPPRPSTKLSSLGEEAQEVARTRRTTLGTLTKRLHKELEWIPLKAMRKESDHRYQSVSELADDVQNYLSGSPLIAGPELARYRLKKFISRNKTLVVSGLAVTIVLIVGIITTSTLAIKLTYSKAKTQRVLEDTTNFLANDLMGSLFREHEDVKQVDIVSILNAASRHLSHRFADNPLAEAQIRRILGLWYKDLGMYQKAEEHLERSMKICQEEYGQDHRETLGAMNNLALVYINQNDYEKAKELLTVALDKGSKYLEKNDPWLWNFIGNLAKTYHKQGEDEKAEQLYVKLLQLLHREVGPEHRDTLGWMNDVALFYMDCDNYEKAEQLLVKALEVGRRKLKEDDTWLTNFISNLAEVYTHQKRYNEAEKLYIEALDKKQRFLGKSNQSVLCLMHTIAHFYEKQGRYEDAKAMLTEAVEIGTRQYGQDDEHTTRHRNCLYRLINNKNISPDINIQKPQQSAGLNEIFIGKPFPQLKFNDLKGNVVNIGKLKGKVVLIDFWATWCGPCTAETPNLISVYNEFKGKGFEIIGISLDTDHEKLNDYLEKNKIQWPNYYDGKSWKSEISSRFGIHGIPEIILIDREGIVREIGLRGDRIREAVSQLIMGKGIIKKTENQKFNQDLNNELITLTNKGIFKIMPSGLHEIPLYLEGKPQCINVLNNKFYVADNNSIFSFDSDGIKQTRTNIPPGLYYIDFTPLEDGRFALLNNREDEVYFISQDGTLQYTAKITKTQNILLQNMNGIQVKDKLIISEDGYNHVVSIDLKNYDVAIFKDLSTLSDWLGVIEYYDRHFYLCLSREVYVFTENSEPILLATIPEENITGITIDGEWAYLSVNFAGKIYKVDLTTGNYQELASNLDYPEGIKLIKKSRIEQKEN